MACTLPYSSKGQYLVAFLERYQYTSLCQQQPIVPSHQYATHQSQVGLHVSRAPQHRRYKSHKIFWYQLQSPRSLEVTLHCLATQFSIRQPIQEASSEIRDNSDPVGELHRVMWHRCMVQGTTGKKKKKKKKKIEGLEIASWRRQKMRMVMICQKSTWTTFLMDSMNWRGR